MLPPPRRPFLASKARRRRGPGIATTRRQWEGRYRSGVIRQFGPGWWRLYADLTAIPPVKEARFS